MVIHVFMNRRGVPARSSQSDEIDFIPSFIRSRCEWLILQRRYANI